MSADSESSEKPTTPHSVSKRDAPITDSPWFWTYIFATAGLIALALAAPKYQSRQTQLERQFLARQEGGQTVKGTDGKTIEVPTEKNLILNLGPLFIICGLLLLVAWGRFWWNRSGANLIAGKPANALDVDESGTPANQKSVSHRTDKLSEE